MIQDIIVYILILLAVAKTIHSCIRIFINEKAINQTTCNGCTGCSVSRSNRVTEKKSKKTSY